ncbi:MAG: hypothetical protein QXL47_00365 [Candidatus Anstonellales archaeon]
MADIGDQVIVTTPSGLELTATKGEDGNWYIEYRDKNNNLVQLTNEWGEQVYLGITPKGRREIMSRKIRGTDVDKKKVDEEKGMIEKALTGTRVFLGQDENMYYIGIGSYGKGKDIYVVNYMGTVKIPKANVNVSIPTTTTTGGPSPTTGGGTKEEKAGSGITTIGKPSPTTGGGTKEEKAGSGITTTIPTKATITTPKTPSKPAAGGEEKSVTKEATIDISTFTKNFKPGEVGVVGGRYTVVYLRNNETRTTTALIFSPTDEIKITNRSGGEVMVEGRGRNNQWTKVIVDTKTGDVRTETGERVTGGVYRNWEYAKGKTQVKAPAGGSINLQKDQQTRLTYTYTQTQQKMGVTY